MSGYDQPRLEQPSTNYTYQPTHQTRPTQPSTSNQMASSSHNQPPSTSIPTPRHQDELISELRINKQHQDEYITELRIRSAVLEVQAKHAQDDKKDTLKGLDVILKAIGRITFSDFDSPLPSPLRALEQAQQAQLPKLDLNTESKITSLEDEIQRLRKENKGLRTRVREQDDENRGRAIFRDGSEQELVGGGNEIIDSYQELDLAPRKKLEDVSHVSVVSRSVWGIAPNKGKREEGKSVKFAELGESAPLKPILRGSQSFTGGVLGENSEIAVTKLVRSWSEPKGHGHVVRVPFDSSSELGSTQVSASSSFASTSTTLPDTPQDEEHGDPDIGMQSLEEYLEESTTALASVEPYEVIDEDFPAAEEAPILPCASSFSLPSLSASSTIIPQPTLLSPIEKLEDEPFHLSEDDCDINDQLAEHQANLSPHSPLPPTIKKVGFTPEGSFLGSSYDPSKLPPSLPTPPSRPIFRRPFNPRPNNNNPFSRVDPAALAASFDEKLWCSREKRDLAFEEHNRWSRGSNQEPFPHIFRYGIQYFPQKSDTNYLRTVIIVNLPIDITTRDVLNKVRGGKVLSCVVLNTVKIAGYKTAKVVFKNDADAEEYVEFTALYPIYFSSSSAAKKAAEATLLTTPTYPLSSRNLLRLNNQTRCISILRFPTNFAIRDLIESIADGSISREEGIVEKWLDEKDTLHLEFSSFDLAGQAWGMMNARYRSLELKWERDPCSGEVEELGDEVIAKPMIPLDRWEGRTLNLTDDEETVESEVDVDIDVKEIMEAEIGIEVSEMGGKGVKGVEWSDISSSTSKQNTTKSVALDENLNKSLTTNQGLSSSIYATPPPPVGSNSTAELPIRTHPQSSLELSDYENEPEPKSLLVKLPPGTPSSLPSISKKANKSKARPLQSPLASPSTFDDSSSSEDECEVEGKSAKKCIAILPIGQENAAEIEKEYPSPTSSTSSHKSLIVKLPLPISTPQSQTKPKSLAKPTGILTPFTASPSPQTPLTALRGNHDIHHSSKKGRSVKHLSTADEGGFGGKLGLGLRERGMENKGMEKKIMPDLDELIGSSESEGDVSGLGGNGVEVVGASSATVVDASRIEAAGDAKVAVGGEGGKVDSAKEEKRNPDEIDLEWESEEDL